MIPYRQEKIRWTEEALAFMFRVKTPFSLQFLRQRVSEETGFDLPPMVVFELLEHFRGRELTSDCGRLKMTLHRGKTAPWMPKESYYVERRIIA